MVIGRSACGRGLGMVGRTFSNDLMENSKAGEGFSPQKCGRTTWSEWEDCGFPNRVNHATTANTDKQGRRRVYAMGGFAGRGRAIAGGERWNELGDVDLDVLELDVGKSKVLVSLPKLTVSCDFNDMN